MLNQRITKVASNKAGARSNTALIILNTTKSDSKDIQKQKKRAECRDPFASQWLVGLQKMESQGMKKETRAIKEVLAEKRLTL